MYNIKDALYTADVLGVGAGNLKISDDLIKDWNITFLINFI